MLWLPAVPLLFVTLLAYVVHCPATVLQLSCNCPATALQRSLLNLKYGGLGSGGPGTAG